MTNLVPASTIEDSTVPPASAWADKPSGKGDEALAAALIVGGVMAGAVFISKTQPVVGEAVGKGIDSIKDGITSRVDGSLTPGASPLMQNAAKGINAAVERTFDTVKKIVT